MVLFLSMPRAGDLLYLGLLESASRTLFLHIGLPFGRRLSRDFQKAMRRRLLQLHICNMKGFGMQYVQPATTVVLRRA